MHELEKLSQKELQSLIIKSVVINDFNTPKNVLKYLSDKKNNDFNNLMQACYLTSCKYGRLELVKYVLTSNELRYNIDINIHNGFALNSACEYGHIDIVKYLLTSPNLKKNLEIIGDTPLYNACLKGHLDIIEYLLTEPKVETQIKKYSDNNFALCTGCDEGQLNVVKLMLTSPKLKHGTNLHIGEDSPFKLACQSQQFNVINYLIFDYNIEKTQAIEKYLNESSNYEILQLFEKRRLNEELNIDLNNTFKLEKRNKI